MGLKKTELYNHLWETANTLRGGIDPSQYKDYVLTILFVKYVTDRYKDDPDAYFVVPEGGSFDDLIESKGKTDIGEKINKVLSKLAEENDLKGVIDHIDFDDSSKLGTGKEKVDRLTRLIAIFENPELNFSKNRADGDDILGDVYEYFMKKFATQAGKSKGQFYTPAEVSRIMAQIIDVEKVTASEQTAYDPTCGSGSLLLKVAVQAKEETGIEISIYGQEIDIDVANLAKMNMIMHGIPSAEIEKGNTLANPIFLENGKLKTFDFAVANPPFSQKNWMNGVDPKNDPYKRFVDGIPPAKNGDYAFLLHFIKSLKPNGKGAIILPHGVLFRGNAEAQIRKNLIKRGYIKGIIGLPPNLFYGTGIPAIIMVIDKENARNRKGIFMIDASEGYRKDGAKNRLRERDIHKIVNTFKNLTEIPGYSKMVSLKEIEQNEYNLNIPRYIENKQKEDIQDILAHLHGGIPATDIDNLTILSEFKDLKNELFDIKEQYYHLKIPTDEIQNIIEQNNSVKQFKITSLNKFRNWANENIKLLQSIDEKTKTRKLIKHLSETLLTTYKDDKLIDEYAIFQILMDYWDDEMKDDVYLIIEKGWTAKPYRIIEKNKKTKEVDKGWTCDLLPKEIVIMEFFKDKKKEIEKLEEQKELIETDIQQLIEDNSGEDSVFDEVKTKKDAESKIKILKDNLEFKQELDLLNKFVHLHNQLSSVKKEIKNKEKELDKKLLQKYLDLTEQDVKHLVIKKKWLERILQGIISELDNIFLNLTTRITELAQRYETPLQQLEQQVYEYEKRVKEHLKKMGFEL